MSGHAYVQRYGNTADKLDVIASCNRRSNGGCGSGRSLAKTPQPTARELRNNSVGTNTVASYLYRHHAPVAGDNAGGFQGSPNATRIFRKPPAPSSDVMRLDSRLAAFRDRSVMREVTAFRLIFIIL